MFGVGYLPLAPGTWCSLVAVIVWYYLYPFVSSTLFVILSVTIFFIGIIASNRRIQDTGNKDPSEVVIDEWAGQWFALILVPHSIQVAFISFMLFRFFDIVKPLSISELEKYSNGWGVMLDDAVAGLYTCGLIHTFIYFS